MAEEPFMKYTEVLAKGMQTPPSSWNADNPSTTAASPSYSQGIGVQTSITPSSNVSIRVSAGSPTASM